MVGLEDGSLSAEGVIEALSALSSAERAALNDLLAPWDSRSNTPPRPSSLLLAAARSPAEAALLSRRFPWLEPVLLGDDDWTGRRALVQLDPATIDGEGLSQGKAEDCWFLAGLGAVAAVDIETVRRNIRVNENGTCTVTIYRDGLPVEVTVSGYVPMEAGAAPCAGQQSSDGRRDPSWVSIYEKAAAQVLGNGAFAGLRAGRPGTGISAVTGIPTDTVKTSATGWTSPSWWRSGSSTLETIGHAMADGRPVSAIVLLNGTDDEIAPWHVYYVTGIEDGLIVVRNPWGRSRDGVLAELRLTEAEFDATFAWRGRAAPPRRFLMTSASAPSVRTVLDWRTSRSRA
ncbi:MAG TPA: C2 family cysteine protease [Friedmanniella sp.]